MATLQEDIQIRLTIRAPNIGVDVIARYVRDAVNNWSGQLHPDDPRQKIDVVSIEHLQWKVVP